jgi:TorA maturation chaperone TorD
VTEDVTGGSEEAAQRRLLSDLLRLIAGYFLEGPNPDVEEVISDSDWQSGLVEAGLVSRVHIDAAAATPEDHSHEFVRMFRIPGDRFVPPFEQAYREGKATVDRAAPLECQRVYTTAGYDLAPFKHIQTDHVGHQTRFLASVLEREAECLELENTEQASTAATWRVGFVRDHCQWWTDFTERVADARPCQQVRVVADILCSMQAVLAEP